MRNYCTKCGARLDPDTGRCPNCDHKDQGQARKETGFKETPSSLNKQNPEDEQKQRTGGKKRLIAIIAAVTCILFLTGWIWSSQNQSTRTLKMSTDLTELQPGTPETVNFTVTVPGGAKGTISITDGNDSVIKTADASQADDSGQLVVPVSLEEKEGCAQKYTAVLGNLTSNETIVYFTPVITEEMFQSLLQVNTDLDGFLKDQGYQDQYTAETLDVAEKWLKSDSRIGKVIRDEDQIFYNTKDGLMGHCAVSGESDTCGSRFQDSGQPIDCFNQKANAQLMSNVYLNSEFTITNQNVLLLRPLVSDDKVCRTYGGSLTDSGNKLAAFTGGSVRTEDDLKVLRTLCDREITDYGIVLIYTHGSYCQNLYYMSLAANTRIKDAKQILEDSNNTSILYGDPDNLEFCRGYVDIEDGLACSENFFTQLYQNETFDNTIIYNASCYGYKDSDLADFFTSHGAACYLGYENSVKCSVEETVRNNLTNSLISDNGKGRSLSIREAVDGLKSGGSWQNGNASVQVYKAGSGLSGFPAGWFSGNSSEQPGDSQSVCCEIKQPDFYLKGQGNITGKLDAATTDGSDPDYSMVKVKCWRWINQNYELQNLDMSVDGKGNFTISSLARGIYVLEIDSPGTAPVLRWLVLDDNTVQGGSVSITINPINLKKYADIVQRYFDVYQSASTPTSRSTCPDNINPDFYTAVPTARQSSSMQTEPVFSLYDLNSDGIPELFIGLQTNGIMNVFDVYTYKDNNAIQIMKDIGYRKGSCELCENGIIKDSSSSSWQDCQIQYHRLPVNDTQLETIDVISEKTGDYYHNEYGNTDYPISKDEFDKIQAEYPEIIVGNYVMNDSDIDALRNGELECNEVY